MRVWVAAFALFIGLAPAGAHGQSQGQNQGSPMNGDRPILDTSRVQQEMAAKANGPLKISFGKKSASWTPATLAALPHKTITVYNEHAKVNQTYSGVPLIELLKPLGVPEKPKGKEFRLYLEAEGSDGYEVVYSVAEVTPDVHDATVMVADAMDGKPLAPDSGPLQLVASGEKRPARWVRGLVAIRVLDAK
jgi:Oxidoreductase molybdopterin binding domain